MTEVPEPPPMLLPPAELPSTQIIERTRHRYEDIHRLLEKRWTISAIARRLNLDRKTVRRFRDTDLDELLASARERRPNGVLEPFNKSGSTLKNLIYDRLPDAVDRPWRTEI